MISEPSLQPMKNTPNSATCSKALAATCIFETVSHLLFELSVAFDSTRMTYARAMAVNLLTGSNAIGVLIF